MNVRDVFEIAGYAKNLSCPLNIELRPGLVVPTERTFTMEGGDDSPFIISVKQNPETQARIRAAYASESQPRACEWKEPGQTTYESYMEAVEHPHHWPSVESTHRTNWAAAEAAAQSVPVEVDVEKTSKAAVHAWRTFVGDPWTKIVSVILNASGIRWRAKQPKLEKPKMEPGELAYTVRYGASAVWPSLASDVKAIWASVENAVLDERGKE